MSSNFPIHGPDLQFYLNAEKVHLNFQGMSAHEFYNKFGFLSLKETLDKPVGNNPTYMLRVTKCLFQQHWYESAVATVVWSIAHRLDLRNVSYSWVMGREAHISDWAPKFTLTGDFVVEESEDNDLPYAAERISLTHVIPASVTSNTNRSLNVWRDFVVAEFYQDRANRASEAAIKVAVDARTAWDEHRKLHPH